MSDATEFAMEVLNVSKWLGGVPVLDGVTVQFAAGRRHAVCGPNGSGKTTLLRILAGRVAADMGEVRFQGVRLDDAPGRANQRRYLTQHFSLYGELTVEENLDFCAAMHGLAKPVEAVAGAIDDFHLHVERRRRAHTLSGGVRQRIMLAAAFLGNPSLVLLDEPTAALDPQVRCDFWNLLDARRTAASTVILTTHLEDDMARCDSIYRLRDGRLQYPLNAERPSNDCAIRGGQ